VFRFRKSPPEVPLLSALEDSLFVVNVTVDMVGSVCAGLGGVPEFLANAFLQTPI
jgi:hypothetical protein